MPTAELVTTLARKSILEVYRDQEANYGSNQEASEQVSVSTHRQADLLCDNEAWPEGAH